MEKKYIIGLDEGTTSCRCVIFDVAQNCIVSIIGKKFKQYYPHSGWVEHNADEIWKAQISTLNESLKSLNIKISQIYGIGITNQRESVVAWQKSTGKPICPSIVWQCRRTADYCNSIPENMKKTIKEKTGLILDAYFSASKIKWILENYPITKELIANNDLCIGTMDSFITFKLTNGKSFVTDYTNASRTMLFNINELCWDKELLKYFNIPISVLPKIVSNSEIVGYAETQIGNIAIASIIGDQQSSLFGEACFKKGMAKNTYGTGCFILTNTGNSIINADKMLSTIAWNISGETTYALEGSIFNAGSCVDWLVDEIKLLESPKLSEKYATEIKSNENVYIVPAFTGLGAPYWNSYCRGVITGLTRATNKNHIIRAVLESMAYNTLDIVKYMEDNNVMLRDLRCDGGVSKNNFLMNFQADLLDVPVLVQSSSEATVLGTIYLCGLTIGAYKNLDAITKNVKFIKTFKPKMTKDKRNELYNGWKNAVSKCLYNEKL